MSRTVTTSTITVENALAKASELLDSAKETANSEWVSNCQYLADGWISIARLLVDREQGRSS